MKHDVLELTLFSKMTLPELRYFISIVNQHTHPDFIFYLRRQCQHHILAGNRWSDFGISEVDFMVLQLLCQQNQIVRDIKKVLTKNQLRPLDLQDADELEMLMEAADELYMDWRRKSPISKNTIWLLINLARTGYQHLHQEQVA